MYSKSELKKDKSSEPPLKYGIHCRFFLFEFCKICIVITDVTKISNFQMHAHHTLYFDLIL